MEQQERESEMTFRRANGTYGPKPVWVLCDFCDAVIEQNPVKGRVKRTCSDVCRQRLWVGHDHPRASEARERLRAQNGGTSKARAELQRDIERRAAARNSDLEVDRRAKTPRAKRSD